MEKCSSLLASLGRREVIDTPVEGGGIVVIIVYCDLS